MNQKSFVKRMLAVALSIIMVLGLLPMSALASDVFPGKPDGMTVSGSTTEIINDQTVWLCPSSGGSIVKKNTGNGYAIYEAAPYGGYTFSHWATYCVATDWWNTFESANRYDEEEGYAFSKSDSKAARYNEKDSQIRVNISNGANYTYYVYAVFVQGVSVSISVEGGGANINAKNLDNYNSSIGEYEHYVQNAEGTVHFGVGKNSQMQVQILSGWATYFEHVYVNDVDVINTSNVYYSEFGSDRRHYYVQTFTVTEPITIRAVTKQRGVNVTFYSNDVNATGTMEKRFLQIYEDYNIPENQFVNEGYIFSGWNTKADGTGTSYTDKQSVRFTIADDGTELTLYAQWERSNYTVSFDANGGTNTMDAVKVGKNSEYTLPVNGFTAPSAYQFKGWATSANGDVISAETITVTADTTLYAIWEKTPAEAPIVQISGNLELIYGEFTNQKITVTVEKKEGYNYSYYWVDLASENFDEVVATSDTFNIPDNMSVGAHFYECAVFATREDNGESSRTIIQDIYVGIKPKEIDNNSADVTLSKTEFTYNGEDQKPDVAITYKGKPLTEGTDYAISWPDDCKNAGLKTVTVDFMGNYSGSVQTTFTIEKATPVVGTVSVNSVVKDTMKPYDVVLTRTDLTIDGKLELDMAADDAMLANKSAYNWVFTPTDTANYNVIKGSVQIDVLDTVAPNGAIKVDTNEWKQIIDNITFGLFFKETQEVTITAADNENGSGIKDILYFVSDKELSNDNLAAAEWKSYTEAFDIEPDGKFVVYAKITDNDGNAIIINSDGVVVDETAAVVSGITDGETYYGQLVFTATDALAGIKSVEIDGIDKTHFEGQYVINADNAEHTVVVTDNAGNVTEYKVTVYKNYTVTYKADGETVSTETVGHGKDATLPAVPAKDGYVGKWDSGGKNITGDTTISVVYTAIPAVNPDEVKPEDKTELEDTKKQIEDMLDDDSYTEDDKKDIQEAIDDIDDALEVIGNVENVEELIDKLPDTITKNDEGAIKAADDAYNALTDYEKSLVDEDAKKALDDAKAALADLNKPADTNSPQTGDNSNMALWIALLFISGGALITLTVVDRKRRTALNK